MVSSLFVPLHNRFADGKAPLPQGAIILGSRDGQIKTSGREYSQPHQIIAHALKSCVVADALQDLGDN
jgi:hypothetical protein